MLKVRFAPLAWSVPWDCDDVGLLEGTDNSEVAELLVTPLKLPAGIELLVPGRLVKLLSTPLLSPLGMSEGVLIPFDQLSTKKRMLAS